MTLHHQQGGLQGAGAGEVAGLQVARLADQPPQPAYVYSVAVPFGGSYAAVCSVHGEFASGGGPRWAEGQQCPACVGEKGRR